MKINLFGISLALSACFANLSCRNSESGNNNLDSLLPSPKLITYTIVKSYPHDTESFTQGLEMQNGVMYESTGNPDNLSNNGSWIGTVNITSGQSEKYAMLPSDVFGEGITILEGKIYRLTWQNQKAYVYNVNDFSKIKDFFYQGEGWGLTNDGKYLIMSNGSNIISYRDPETFKEIRQISVHDNTGMKNNLNELEFINGHVFANVWQTNQILKIDTANGEVKGILDLSEIVRSNPELATPKTDVMNGIAWDSTTKSMYITGKKWPKLFALKIN